MKDQSPIVKILLVTVTALVVHLVGTSLITRFFNRYNYRFGEYKQSKS